MAPRALGALLALVAAMLLLASLAGGIAPKLVPGWWDGHPRVDGKTIERKEIHVGLLGGHGCNLGETVTCQELPTGAMLEPVGIVELSAVGATFATLLALMVSVWKLGERRKVLGKVVLGETLAMAAVGGVLLLVGPAIRSTQHVDVPIGLGMWMFWGAVGSAAIASMIAMRVEREPLRLRASKVKVPTPPPQPEPEPPPPQPSAPPAFDFSAMIREDERRANVPSPGGKLAGPSGPLSPIASVMSPSVIGERLATEPALAAMGIRTPIASAPAAETPPPPRPSSPSVPPRPSSPSVPPAAPIRAKAASLPPASRPKVPAPDVAPVTAVEIDAEAKALAAAAAKIVVPGIPLASLGSASIDATIERPRDGAAPHDSAATIARPRISAPAIDTMPGVMPPKPRVPAPPPRAVATEAPAPADKAAEELETARAAQVPISTAPASLPPPQKIAEVAGQAPACPQCEAPMAWVEEHLRFYCPQCRMYF